MSTNLRTVTFLFTDLENSTPLWESYPDLMQELSHRHDALIREAIEFHQGRVVKTTGDGFHAVFSAASEGLAAALTGQLAMVEEPWPKETGPLRVRMGLHTGESRQRDGDYYGSSVNRAARVMDLANGGQILISGTTAGLVRSSLPPQVSLSDLGEHHLRGLAIADRIFQVHHPALPDDVPPLKAFSAAKHNLPLQLTTFVGREREIAEVDRLLKQTQLLTLLGPGGTGKTRLMMEVARDMLEDFDDGVWLVELAPLTDPDLIAEQVASVLTVQAQPGRTMTEALVEYLRRKELLLLLDNVEHLVREAAELAEYLLSNCPKLKILVTGREALFIGGETTLQIPSLSLPAGNGTVTLEEISASEGVELFLIRAQEVHPGFELSRSNADTIVEIVRRLDGIPFALELAASRTRMLTVEQIAERLSDRFRLLTGGRRTALPRQQTLQAMIDWSWNLLDEKERLLLQRLSVFSRGWSLEAAQRVAGDPPLDEYDVFDLLEQLVNKSLVTVKYPPGGSARYGMLESIRQYSRDRLFEAGEGEILRNRHADYFVTFAEEAGPHLRQSTMLPWVERITLELDNLRVVLAWTLEDRPELALRIGAHLLYIEPHWLTSKEAQSWLEPAIEKTREMLGKPESKARPADFIWALQGLAMSNAWQGRFAAALQLVEESIRLARQYGELRAVANGLLLKNVSDFFFVSAERTEDFKEAIAISRENGFRRELAFALGGYAFSLKAHGKSDQARLYFEEVFELLREIDNPRLNASTYRLHGLLAELEGDFEAAKDYTLIALENSEALNDHRSLAANRSDMGHILRQEGKFDEAEAYYRRTIVAWQEQGHGPAVAHQLECFAYIAIARGAHEHAAMLLGAATKAREQMDALSTDPREIEDLARAMTQLAKTMGEEKRDKVMAEGRLMDLDEAVQLALSARS